MGNGFLRGRWPVSVLILANVWVSVACSNRPTAPSQADAQTVRFAGTLSPGGFASHPFTADRSGTVTATMTTSAPLDLVFFTSAAPSPPCVRNDCVPSIRPSDAQIDIENGTKRLTFTVSRTQVVYFVVWHVLDVGETRTYTIDVTLQ